MKCPKCGGTNCHLTVSQVTSHSKGYGFGKGCCGYILMGPLGLLCGLCGGTSTTSETTELWVCDSCGAKFTAKESQRSNAFEEKFYYEHAMEYPEYSENRMVKAFTEIYAKELCTSELVDKVLIRKNDNEAFKKHKEICGECLEKELILYAVEDVSGMIVTLKQIAVGDYYFELSKIKSISYQGNVVYINQYCTRFSSENIAKKVFDLLNRTIGSAYNIEARSFESYSQILEYLQTTFDFEDTLFKAHYSSQEEYQQYIEGLNSEAWDRLKKVDNERFKKYEEVDGGRTDAVIQFAIADLILSIVVVGCGWATFDSWIAGVFCGLLTLIVVGIVLSQVYRTVDVDMDKFSTEILPIELSKLNKEHTRKPIERIGNILVTESHVYKELPGMSGVAKLPEKSPIRSLKITGKVMLILAILASLYMIISVVYEKRKDVEVEKPFETNAVIEQTTEINVELESQEQPMVTESFNFQIGEPVSTDMFEFIVTDAYVLDYLSENKKIPEGAIYVAVEYEYKNISKQPISSWDLPTVRLADGNDAVYSQDADADWYFEGYSDEKAISDMNPGIKTRGAKIFEVAIDVLNAGGMKVYVEADKNFLVDLELSYEPIASNAFAIPVEEIFEEFDINGQAVWSNDLNNIYMIPEMDVREGYEEIILFSIEPNTYDYAMYYFCDVEEIATTENGGINCTGIVYDYHSGEEVGSIRVIWDSYETMDYPTVYIENGAIDADLAGDYHYHGLTE